MTEKQLKYVFLYDSGLTMAKIAQIYGVNASTVSRTIHRGKKLPQARKQPIQRRLCSKVKYCHGCQYASVCNNEAAHQIKPKSDAITTRKGRYQY